MRRLIYLLMAAVTLLDVPPLDAASFMPPKRPAQPTTPAKPKAKKATTAPVPKRVAADTIFTVNGVSFGMMRVAGGTFTMGATVEQGSDAEVTEKPIHSVTLNDYWIGQTEVTEGLWLAVMGDYPIKNYQAKKGDDYPVAFVDWNGCQLFIAKLNELTGAHFRLPTEAEWEYASRGGNKTKNYKYSGSNRLRDVAWYSDNSGCDVHPVATKLPNELGIYDMSGNVAEWCSDWYGSYTSSPQTSPIGPSSGTERVMRDGGPCLPSWAYRVSYRSHKPQSYSNFSFGFRLAF